MNQNYNTGLFKLDDFSCDVSKESESHCVLNMKVSVQHNNLYGAYTGKIYDSSLKPVIV